jgi:hypothetical protein
MNEMIPEPTRGDFENWRNSYVTQWYFSRIQQMIEERQATLGMGGTLNRVDMVSTQTLTSEYVGFIDGCNECLLIETQVEMEEPDGEDV